MSKSDSKNDKLHGGNYYKYEETKQALENCLKEDRRAAEIAKRVGVSLPTLYKYKAMLSLETGNNYMTREERLFLVKQGDLLASKAK